MKRLFALVVVLSPLLLTACMEDGATHQVARPRNTDSLEGAIPVNSIYVFNDVGYKGTVTRLDNVLAMTPEAIHSIERPDRASSLQWRLPPGVVVMLYEGTSGKGNQVALWGSGQSPSLTLWDANDKLAGWGWYNVGGGSASTGLSAPLSPRPPLAAPTTALPPGSIELYRDRDFRGTMTPMNVTGQTMGAFHNARGGNDQMTSLRWNLPPGVVVVFYENAGGTGRQLALWGSGQYASVDPMNFNDRFTDWAWYDVNRQ